MTTATLDSLEVDFRAWLAADSGVAALVGNNAFFTAVAPRLDGYFIGTRVDQKDAMHTTSIGPGHAVQARIVVACCYKGVDPVNDYAQAKAVAQAVKARVNQVNGTWQMGNTWVYQMSIDEQIEGEQGKTETDDPFNFHAGTSSGIQQVQVPVALHYWSPNC